MLVTVTFITVGGAGVGVPEGAGVGAGDGAGDGAGAGVVLLMITGCMILLTITLGTLWE